MRGEFSRFRKQQMPGKEHSQLRKLKVGHCGEQVEFCGFTKRKKLGPILIKRWRFK